eukprot:gb/GFBE01031987.1/.p1 GENE.gb/GFBE01031987.1/~~gb/GFBE01031987.1/.p1  ORF type:complete len:668 (+),score=296.96 gb/GFBE01031987.1/:1-2004(+)
MKCLAWTATLSVALLASAADVTPVGKVIEMLKDMRTKGEKEMQDEQVQYAAFKQFCDSTAVEKQREISEGEERIEVLSAEVEKSDADASRLATEITALTADADSAESEKQEATKIRESEREDFKAMLKDYTQSVDAIGRALKELKSTKTKQESAMVQLSSLQLPEKASRGLHALLSEGFSTKEDNILDSLSSDLTPEGDIYEFQSSGVIGMLEKLQDKFVDERVKLEKEEVTKKHAYDLLMQSLGNKATEAKKEIQQKTTFKAKRLQDKASADSDLTETKAGLQVDKSYADDLAVSCKKKAADFDERQKLRGEELEAIQKAADIMSGPEISGGFLQTAAKPAAGTALAQLRGESPVQAQVARFLQKEATALNSRVLSALAQRASADPMAKVKKMIEDLIVRMQEQANEEATKKAWCDTELSTNKATREEKSDAVDGLQAEIDELQATITKLGEDVTTLSTELVELNTAMSEATELRQKEKIKNQATVKDSKEAQGAVARAIMVLKDFYTKAGEVLLQTGAQAKQPEGAPATFGEEPYRGMQGAQGGVTGMLEVIESDFARLEAETTAAEAAAQKEYEGFMQDSKVTKAEKSKEQEHKTAKKQDKASELINMQADLQGTQKELDASMEYFEKLKPDCLDAGTSYEERKLRREQEIKDLKEAMEMLSTM